MAKWQSGKVAKWQSGKVAKWQSGTGTVAQWHSSKVALAQWQGGSGSLGFGNGVWVYWFVPFSSSQFGVSKIKFQLQFEAAAPNSVSVRFRCRIRNIENSEYRKEVNGKFI